MLKALIVGVPLFVCNIVFCIWLLDNINHSAQIRGVEHLAQTNISVAYHDGLMKNDAAIFKGIHNIESNITDLKNEVHRLSNGS
jgi:hypothetical protein